MNKKSVLYILLDAVFLIVFNTVFFVLGGTDHPASVWLSYAFIHFAYVMVLLTPLLIRKGTSAAVFGFSLYSLSAVYFMTEFIVGLIFILLRFSSIKAPLTVQIILAGLYAVALLSNMIANEHTAESEARRETEVAYIKNASARVKALLGEAKDKQAEKDLERTYDLLHSSPTRSTSEVKSLEQEILMKVSSLESAVHAGQHERVRSLCREIHSLVAKRNQSLRLSQ